MKSDRISGNVYQEIHREIIELSKAGNARAQFELYSLYSKALYNVCMRILTSREEAEDALQDAFLEIFEKLESFRYEAAFGAWAKRVTINLCLNKLKRKKPDLIFRDSSLEKNHVEENEPDISKIQLEVEKVHKAINKLPDGYRLILNLYLFEGYDHVEISEILGISESTSKTQYMKARKKVKELIMNEI